MANDDGVIAAARALAAATEPVAGQVHFSPECHAEYARLGFAPSPGMVGTTELPDRSAYLTSRGSVMGQVRPTVVAAAFAVFNPAVVVPAVEARLTTILTPWGEAIREAGGYLSPATRFTWTR